MKKIIYSLITIFTLIMISGCGNDTAINFKEDPDHDIMTGVTFKFTGKSEHFGFQTGKVNYNNEDKQILITNFKLIKNIGNVDSYSLNVYFNNTPLFTDEKTKVGNEGINSHLKDIVIAESGKANDISTDAFFDTTKENFKESIKIVIEYCKKDICKKEDIKIFYVETDEQ